MKGLLKEIINETTLKVVPLESTEDSVYVECDRYIIENLKEEFSGPEPTIIIEYDSNKKMITGDENGIF